MGDRVNLTAIRADLAAVCTGALADEVTVYDHTPDQLAVPAVLIGWADPWLTPATVCDWRAGLNVLAVAGRFEPGGQLETMETIVADLIDTLEASPYEIGITTAPFAAVIAGVNYIAAQITVHIQT